MTCSSPPALDDARLLAYIDKEVDREALVHLEQCPHCRERARRLARLQAYLATRLHRAICPDPLELGEYHLDVLPPDRAAAVAAHLADCPHCAREVAQLAGYLGELETSLTPRPLEVMREQVRVLVARLIGGGSEHGLFGQPALSPIAAGVRGDDRAPLIYQVEDIQMVIEIQEDAEHMDHKTILGLVIGLSEGQTFKAHLWRSGQCIETAEIDELGNFIFSDLSPAHYELILSSPETEIHIKGLWVGSGQSES